MVDAVGMADLAQVPFNNTIAQLDELNTAKTVATSNAQSLHTTSSSTHGSTHLGTHGWITCLHYIQIEKMMLGPE